MPEIVELADPDRVTVGTVGPVGQRVFLLQARGSGRAVTMKLEKDQVARLCKVLGSLLRGLAQPAEINTELLDLEPFSEPDFVVRKLSVAFDQTRDRVLLLCEELSTDEGDDDEPLDEREPEGSAARLAMTREQALGLAIRGTELVESGRPTCPRCGYPLDPRGHVCPRMNGNVPPIT